MLKILAKTNLIYFGMNSFIRTKNSQKFCPLKTNFNTGLKLYVLNFTHFLCIFSVQIHSLLSSARFCQGRGGNYRQKWMFVLWLCFFFPKIFSNGESKEKVKQKCGFFMKKIFFLKVYFIALFNIYFYLGVGLF